MYIDAVHILFGCCAIVFMLSGLMVFAWLRDRHARWLLWMSALFVFGGVSLGLLLTPDIGGSPAIIFGTGTFIVAFFLVWTGMRVFENRQPLWLPLLIAVCGWFILTMALGSENIVAEAAMAQSVLGSGAIGLAGYELWRGRGDALWSRWGLILLFGVVALFFGARLPFISSLPYPFGTLEQRFDWTAGFVVTLFCAAMMLAFLCLSLAREKAERELREVSLTDPLTGLLNRRAFNADIARIAQRHHTNGSSFCLLMLDLDHFKTVNDVHGHAVGDRVLMHFAGLVGRCIRPQDQLYRFGGEEFCCILPETSEFEAVIVAERVRSAFRLSDLQASGRRVHTTVSIGVASSLMGEGDAVRMLTLADTALYRAKRLGRDRVAVAFDGPSGPDDVGWAVA